MDLFKFCDFLIHVMYFYTAPSAAPTSVILSAVTFSSITVQWGAVDCIHHNGDITGYSVQYGVQGNGNAQYLNIPGGSVTEATISSLMPSTTYSIQVAAVNSAGIGVYSTSYSMETTGEQCVCKFPPNFASM